MWKTSLCNKIDSTLFIFLFFDWRRIRYIFFLTTFLWCHAMFLDSWSKTCIAGLVCGRISLTPVPCPSGWSLVESTSCPTSNARFEFPQTASQISMRLELRVNFPQLPTLRSNKAKSSQVSKFPRGRPTRSSINFWDFSLDHHKVFLQISGSS